VNKVKIGLVGTGTIAHIMHLPGIATMREMGLVELVAVADVFVEKAVAAAQEYDVESHFGSLDQMLARADFDLLVNNTPIPQHYEVTLAALRAGRHVYTQKPMTTTVAEATHLIEEARSRNLTLAVAPEHPTRPIVKKLASLIADGVIGKVTFARVQSSHDGPEKHNVPRDSTWFYKPGSNPILDLGVHGLSQITAIVGPVKRVTCVSGRSQDVRLTTKGPFAGKKIDVEIDDNSLLTLDFGDARFAYLDATYCVPASLSPRMEIHGTEGTLTVVARPDNPREADLRLYRTATDSWEEVEVPAAPPVRDLGVLHVVECLREGTPLLLTGERGRHLVEVLAKAPEAAAQGRTLDIETTF
jgi:predicted dehydrogenase